MPVGQPRGGECIWQVPVAGTSASKALGMRVLHCCLRRDEHPSPPPEGLALITFDTQSLPWTGCLVSKALGTHASGGSLWPSVLSGPKAYGS